MNDNIEKEEKESGIVELKVDDFNVCGSLIF